MIHAELIALRSVGIQPPERTDASFPRDNPLPSVTCPATGLWALASVRLTRGA